MKTPIVYLAAVLLAASPLTSVQAGEKVMPDRGPIPFEVYDSNGDGFVSPLEFTEMRNKRIQEKTDQGYPMKGVKTRGAPAFAAFDRDGDGKLTREELQAGQMERWQEQRQQRWEEKSQRGPGPRGGAGGGPNR